MPNLRLRQTNAKTDGSMHVFSPLGLGQQPIFVDNALLDIEQRLIRIVCGLVVFAKKVDLARRLTIIGQTA